MQNFPFGQFPGVGEQLRLTASLVHGNRLLQGFCCGDGSAIVTEASLTSRAALHHHW